MTKHKHYTRRRNKLHRASRRKTTSRRPKRNRRSASLILRKRTGGKSVYETTDFYDRVLDFAFGRGRFADIRNDATEEEKNRMLLYSLLEDLNRRITRYPNNPRVDVWNGLVENVNRALADENYDEIRQFASQYDNARQLALGLRQPDVHPMETT